MAWPICLRLERQLVVRAFSRAWAKTGKRIAARMAMMAITTSSSIRVNPGRPGDKQARAGRRQHCFMTASLVRPEVRKDVVPTRAVARGIPRLDLPDHLVLQTFGVAVHEEAVEDALRRHTPVRGLHIGLEQVPRHGEPHVSGLEG